jgi:hypothetical protein
MSYCNDPACPVQLIPLIFIGVHPDGGQMPSFLAPPPPGNLLSMKCMLSTNGSSQQVKKKKYTRASTSVSPERGDAQS